MSHAPQSHFAEKSRPAGHPALRVISPDEEAAPPCNRKRRIVMGALLGLLVAGLAVALQPDRVRAVRDRFIPKRWGVVEAGKIYRSGQISTALVKETLEKHGIRRVVDLTSDKDTPEKEYHDAELVAISELGIERTLCPLISDGTGDVTIYAAAVKAIVDAEQAGDPVLVHCAAGTQRTGGVVALYRLFVQEKPPREVFAEMKRYKYDPVYSPKLLAYLNDHMAELAAELVRNGAIAEAPEKLPVLSAE